MLPVLQQAVGGVTLKQHQEDAGHRHRLVIQALVVVVRQGCRSPNHYRPSRLVQAGMSPTHVRGRKGNGRGKSIRGDKVQMAGARDKWPEPVQCFCVCACESFSFFFSSCLGAHFVPPPFFFPFSSTKMGACSFGAERERMEKVSPGQGDRAVPLTRPKRHSRNADWHLVADA